MLVYRFLQQVRSARFTGAARVGGALLVGAFFLCVTATTTADAAAVKDLKAKKYTRDYTLSGGKVLQGAGIGKTVIRGTVRVRDAGVVRNLTIRKGGIFVLAGARVTIENVRIESAPGTAVEVRAGGAITLRNVQIVRPRGKGIYAWRNAHVTILNSEIRDSRNEEGIDLRSGISGVIAGNTIAGNREGGIEVIVGGSTVRITGNTIAHNGASGIATQFYAHAAARGALTITKNTLRDNRNYGIDCKVPQGGGFAASYWRNALTVQDNVIARNRAGAIAPRCGGVKNIDMAAIIATRKKRAAEAAAKERAERERAARERARRVAYEKSIEDAFAHADALRSAADDARAQCLTQARLHRMVFGTSDACRTALDRVRNDIAAIEKEVEDLQVRMPDASYRTRITELTARIADEKGVAARYDADFRVPSLQHRVSTFLKNLVS